MDLPRQPQSDSLEPSPPYLQLNQESVRSYCSRLLSILPNGAETSGCLLAQVEIALLILC